MAVGIEQIAGPVNAGDIIMRDEEAPRGAAALLNKMINKGTQGMYKLPEQDKEMPGFMKDAIKESEQAAVDPSDFRTILRILEAGGNPEDYMEEVKLDASDFRTILKLLEQGFSMEDIESMTQAKMTKDGPTKGLTMKDIANLDQAAVQGGKINFLGEQPEVKAPIRAQSHADSPPTQLAYITDAEKDLLVKANIHGSMDGKPNPGPAGIESLDDFFNIPGGGVGGGSSDRGESSRTREDYGIGSGQAVGGSDGGTVFQQQDDGSYKQVDAATQQAAEEKAQQTIAEEQQKGKAAYEKFLQDTAAASETFQTGSTDSTDKTLDFVNKRIAELEKEKDLSREDKKLLRNLYDRRFNILGGKTSTGESKIKTDDDEEEDEKSAIDKIMQFFIPGSGFLGEALNAPPILGFNEAQQKRAEDLLAEYRSGDGKRKGSFFDFLKGKGQYYDEDGNLTREGLVKGLRSIDMGEGASALETLKRDQRADYFDIMGMPATTGAIDDLAKSKTYNLNEYKDASGKLTAEGRKFADYNNKVFEARMLMNQRDDQKNRVNQGTGGGGGGTTPADTTPDTTPDADPRAGQFNVGGTMPYTDERTGNVEQFVPLGRRFQLKEDGQFRGKTPFTMDDVMKYATQGGFQQLEPFQEYLARRKKFLGEEDPEYFDEDGNVIYGGPA